MFQLRARELVICIEYCFVFCLPCLFWRRYNSRQAHLQNWPLISKNQRTGHDLFDGERLDVDDVWKAFAGLQYDSIDYGFHPHLFWRLQLLKAPGVFFSLAYSQYSKTRIDLQFFHSWHFFSPSLFCGQSNESQSKPLVRHPFLRTKHRWTSSTHTWLW